MDLIKSVCSREWSQWTKSTECVLKNGVSSRLYHRRCKALSGEEARGSCVGKHTKTRSCCPNICNCTGTDVYCDRRDINNTEFLADVSIHTIRLHLQSNKISVIEDNAFKNCTNLQYLYLSSNKISVIDDNAFKNCTKILQLYLDSNAITMIGKNVLNGLGDLRTLYLQGNDIRVIQEGAFDGLKKIRHLLLGSLHICSCNVVKEVEKLQQRNVTVSYSCPSSSKINGTVRSDMVRSVCSGEWTQWSKSAECVLQNGVSSTPYHRICKALSGEDTRESCIGNHTKTQFCTYRMSQPVTRSLTSKAKGKIVLKHLTLNGTQVPDGNLRNILNTKGSIYEKLLQDSRQALLTLHQNSNENVRDVQIVQMMVGSLVIEYVIIVKTHENQLLNGLKPMINITTDFYLDESSFAAETSPQLITISDYDECKEDIEACDTNAYCITFPDSVSYGCQCKDTYVGNGFKCEKGEEPGDNHRMIVIISIVVVVFVAVLIAMLICYLKHHTGNKMLKNFKEIKNTQQQADVTAFQNPTYNNMQ